jgi:hypothetical protein
MPSVLHEALRELFAKRPELVAKLLQGRLWLPSDSFVPLDSELTDPRMKQLLPDAVLASPSADAPAVIVIIEVQLSVIESKRRVWPQYAANAHSHYDCRVELVVVTPYAEVERWARQPIRIGRRHAMTPDVLGPSAIPVLDAPAIAGDPVLAMLSTLAHMDDPRCAQQALWTLEALASWDQDAEGRLADILQAALTVAVRDRMEDLMRTGKYEYQSDFAKKYFARGREEGREEGRAVGQARALLLVLRSRGIDLPDDVIARIGNERDEARLDAWIRRAVTAVDVDDLFADE